ncbi:hypothetical protein PInf_002611 [Phytophthora infestans]|nr:hypothetical protein PInf_002611 [Phytophthora infestans]
MGKSRENRVFMSASSSGALRYRRKALAPADNQQPEQQPAGPKQLQQLKALPNHSNSNGSRSRSNRSSPVLHFQPKLRQPKQPTLLKHLLWKAKAGQPTPSLLTLTHQQQRSRDQEEEEDYEDEEVIFAREQREAYKLLASEASALAATKLKAMATLPSSELFASESSSQETQSGSEEEDVILPYSDMFTMVQLPAEWQVYKEQEGDAEETDGEENSNRVVPSEILTTPTKKQGELPVDKAAMIHCKRENYKLKQKQKRAATNGQKRFQKQVHWEKIEWVCRAEKHAGSTQDDELKDAVPYIVVGDVSCPMVSIPDELSFMSTEVVCKQEISSDSEEAIVDVRQHVIAMLDRSKETQIQYRESFVVENSGFDAVSSYDFFESRFCEIQSSSGIVYY